MANTFTSFSIMNLSEISFIGGTYKELNFDVFDEAGNAVNVSSYTFKWLLAPYGDPESTVLSKTGVSRVSSGSIVSSGYSNRFTVYLYSYDTVGLSGKYIQQPVIVIADGYEFRLGQGNIIIVPATSYMTVSETQSLTQQVSTLITEISASLVVASGSANTAYRSATTGWTPLSQSWYYASASSILAPGDYTSVLQKGMKVQWTQSSANRYGVLSANSVYSGSNTVITIIPNNDYPVLNTTISNPQISFQDNPVGYPGWFSYTPLWTAASVNPSIGDGTLSGRYSVQGKTCNIQITMTAGAATTFGSGNWSVGLPLAVSATALSTDFMLRARDSGTANYGYYGFVVATGTVLSGLIDLTQNINTVYWSSTTPFSWGNGDSFVITGRYEF